MDNRIPLRRGRPAKQIDLETLPNQARRLRLNSGYTLQHVADLLGVSIRSVQEFERFGTGIDRRKIYALASLYEIDPRELETSGPLFFSQNSTV